MWWKCSSDKVWASIAIKALSGATKLKWSLGWKNSPYPYTYFSKSFTCHLGRGTYRIEVRGKDLAGNTQTRVGTARLTVK